MCVWLSGSTVETPNGWPHCNNSIREAYLHPFIVGYAVYRDIGRFYIKHQYTHTHARARAYAPTRAQKMRRAQGTQPIFRSCDLAAMASALLKYNRGQGK